MAHTEELIARLEAAGLDIFWQGGATPDQIDRVEQRLALRLPSAFRQFLALCGGGGVVEREISGIEENDAALEYAGTVVGDTLACRASFALPLHLAVIYSHDDEVCWCLDTEDTGDGDCRVVSYSLARRRIDGVIAPGFEAFFETYVAEQLADD